MIITVFLYWKHAYLLYQQLLQLKDGFIKLGRQRVLAFFTCFDFYIFPTQESTFDVVQFFHSLSLSKYMYQKLIVIYLISDINATMLD